MKSVVLSLDLINPYKILHDYEDINCDLSKSGGQSVFIGYMRSSSNGNNDILSMKLDYYPEMTEKYLLKLREKAIKSHNLHNVFIVHRVGEVKPKECLVVVACWSEHRKEAIAAVKFILEDLKHNAPLWKKELFSNQTSKWVEKNIK